MDHGLLQNLPRTKTYRKRNRGGRSDDRSGRCSRRLGRSQALVYRSLTGSSYPSSHRQGSQPPPLVKSSGCAGGLLLLLHHSPYFTLHLFPAYRALLWEMLSMLGGSLVRRYLSPALLCHWTGRWIEGKIIGICEQNLNGDESLPHAVTSAPCSLPLYLFLAVLFPNSSSTQGVFLDWDIIPLIHIFLGCNWTLLMGILANRRTMIELESTSLLVYTLQCRVRAWGCWCHWRLIVDLAELQWNHGQRSTSEPLAQWPGPEIVAVCVYWWLRAFANIAHWCVIATATACLLRTPLLPSPRTHVHHQLR